MKMKKLFSSPLFLFFAATAALWAVYCLFLSLGLIFICWVYIGLFTALLLSYVILTRGYFNTPLPKEAPPTVNAAEYEALREKISRYQEKLRWVPTVCLAIVFVFAIDFIDLYFISKLFNR